MGASRDVSRTSRLGFMGLGSFSSVSVCTVPSTLSELTVCLC